VSSPGAPEVPVEADVIVVGAGTAGCVLARRLHDAGLRVLLLEAGAEATVDAITDPARLHELWHSSYDWAFQTVPQRHAAGRQLHLPRGRAVGGSHALNAMIWVRGNPADYDTWAYLGNPGWSWSDVEPVFARIEGSKEGAGLLDVSRDHRPDPVHGAIVEAAVAAGLPFNDDYNSGHQDGVSYTQLTLRDGRRLMTADAYLAAVRPGVTVLAGATARRLLFDGTRCTGVEWERAGAVERTRAAAEVVLAAGAIGTPLLLQRSGVGDADRLRAAGVDVVGHLPGVGRNLTDHWLVPAIWTARRPIEHAPGLPQAQSHLFWRSDPGRVVPDLQPCHFGVPLYEPWMDGPDNAFSLMAGLVRPASRGRVEISGPDPADPPLIDPRVLAAESDVDALVAAVELVREIAAQPPLYRDWGARERYPGELAGDAAALREYVRRTVITYHHQSGTCAMGAGEDSVVGATLRVHGLAGLSIADASVMPTVPTGNTNAPAAMLGERGSQFLLARHGLAPPR
jgi:choline dehydrogenase